MLTSVDPAHDYMYQYDALDRLVSEFQWVTGLNEVVGFTSQFDQSGNRREMTAQFIVNMPWDFVNHYSYDGLNRLTQITQQGLGDNAVAAKRVNFTYDLAGQVDTIQRYSSLDTSAPVAVSDFTFDSAGRLKELAHFDGTDFNPSTGTLLAGYGYTWNQRHELTGLDFLPNGANSPFNYSAEDVISYNYDARSQLIGANYTTQTDETYTYDDNGNRLEVTNTAGAGQDYITGRDNRLVNDGTFTYTYDNEGNRLTRTRISSAQADDKVVEYTWDHRNRLIKVTNKNNFGSVTKTVEHGYDAANQWIKRVVDPDGAATSAAIEQTIFIHEDGQVVLEFDKTGTGNLETSNLSHRYLWGPAVDQLLADEVVNSLADAELNERLWALPDHLGTIRDMVDDDGTVRKHIVFDSYGRITGETFRDTGGDVVSASHAEAIEQLFDYTGHARDMATNTIHARRRWIDADTGQFLSQDLIWDGYNRRVYAGNEPTTHSDANGLERRRVGHGSLRSRLYGEVDDWNYGTSTGWSIIDAPIASLGSVAGNLIGKPTVWLVTYWREDTHCDRVDAILVRQAVINESSEMSAWGAGVNLYAGATTDRIAFGAVGYDPIADRPLSDSERIQNIAGGTAGYAGTWVPIAAGTRMITPAATVSRPTGAFYSVAYEMRLSPGAYPSLSRGAHFQMANEALLTAMKGDVCVANAMRQLGISLERTPMGLAPRRPPVGWTWHHGTQPGIMQLTPRAQHTTGSIWWDTLHPGGRGGYSIWGEQ
jgi:RHS repeat-associated protein